LWDLLARSPWSGWGITTLFSSNGFLQRNPAVVEETDEPIGSSLSNVTLTDVDENGKPLYEITARRADYSSETRAADVFIVTGKFYRDGKPIIEISGEGGAVDQDNKEIAIEGNVKAVAVEENIVLTADRMVWLADQDLLTGKGNIKLEKTDEKITLTGKNLIANPNKIFFRSPKKWWVRWSIRRCCWKVRP
jgi:LPS export ABC transporter protein LptC